MADSHVLAEFIKPTPRGGQWPAYSVGVSVCVCTRVISGALLLIEFLGRAQAINVSVTV